ncbi:MAG TPA: IPTL-CTERM sorting domain-containing protein [Candidatus Polarisedimenticolia bacterium]|nr:IPTL-CTERM sorting domain-containing protein [Candidatus Polarisedimenticolia bacterium]
MKGITASPARTALKAAALAGLLAAAGIAALDPVEACSELRRVQVRQIMATSPTAFMATIGNGSIFAPASLPATCTCGILLPNNLTPGNPVPVDSTGATITQFTGFTPNAGTAAEFQAMSPAPAGHTWHGFSTPVTAGLVSGQAVSLRFNMTSSTPGDAAVFQSQLDGRRIGAAASDAMGVNFDPEHRGIAVIGSDASEIPTLSGWGMILLAASLAAAAVVVIRRRRPALAA